MYVAVREKTEEMKGGGVLLYVANDRLPRIGSEHLAAFDRLCDQLCALCEDLTCAKGVVADLGVAHIVIRGQTDGAAVGLDDLPGVIGLQLVQGGGGGRNDHVAEGFGGLAHAVHDDEDNGLLVHGK
mgnify:CR=1 FL=1